MMQFSPIETELHVAFAWNGRAAGVNEWHRSRCVQRKDTSVFGRKCPVCGRSEARYIAITYTTTAYKHFIESIRAAIPRCELLDAEIVDVYIEVSLWKMRDTDNVIKPVIDALKGFVISDDRYVRNLNVCRTYHKKAERDRIAVKVYRTK